MNRAVYSKYDVLTYHALYGKIISTFNSTTFSIYGLISHGLARYLACTIIMREIAMNESCRAYSKIQQVKRKEACCSS